MIVYGERRAVDAEMQPERDHAPSLFNQARSVRRPTEFWEKGSRIAWLTPSSKP